MDYKALVLDLDGTLVWRGRPAVSDTVTKTLGELQQRGVTIIFATGRAGFASIGDAIGTDFSPDYRVCANGAYIVDKDNEPIYECYFNVDQIERLVDFVEENNYRINFSFEDAYYSYIGYEAFVEAYKDHIGSASKVKDGTDRTRHHQNMPYGGYTTMPTHAAKEFSDANPDLKLMQSVPGSYDICLSDIDKMTGIEMLLKKLDISWEQVVAVGDGENDIEMLKKAGVGAAMDNASDVVKAAADYIAPDVGDDGVLEVIEKYFG